jgi:Serine/threonine protein kinase
MTGSRDLCEQCGKRRVDLFCAVIAMGLDFNELCCCDVSAEFVEAATSAPVVVCRKCYKRMQDAESTGSTQWVFRNSFCSCPAPEPQELDSAMVEELVQQLVDQKRKKKERLSKDEPEIQVDDRKFPYESFKPLKHIDSAGGRIFKCRDRQLGTLVVIKILKTRNLQQHQLNQLQNEAKFVSELDHENILKVLDFGILREVYPFIVTEYAESETLRSVLDKSGRLQIYTAVQIISQVCDALGHAHGRGVFHWNLTPEKILLKNPTSTDPEVKLADFGFALNAVTEGTFQTEQGMTLVGTTGYMSPEQANGKDFDASSEVYTIGCVLFEMLTGVLPFNGQTQREVLIQQTQRPVPKLSEMSRREFPAELERIVNRCLQPNKEDRHSSVAQLRRSINTFTRRTSVVPEAIPEAQWKVLLREHKAAISLGVVGVLAISAWATFAWLTSESAYNALGKPGSPMESFFVAIGNDRAKVQLGKSYLDGIGVKRDPSKAVVLFSDAAAHGSTPAEFWLGYCYLKGYARLQEHGEGGYAGAFTSVSQAAEVEQKNYAKAYALISKAADKGYPAAERYKGLLIRIGMNQTGQIAPTSKGRIQRLADSDSWIKKAADHGDPEAINFLGLQKAEEFGWSAQAYAGAFDYSKKSETKRRSVRSVSTSRPSRSTRCAIQYGFVL